MDSTPNIKPTIRDAGTLGAFVEAALHHVRFDGFPHRLVLEVLYNACAVLDLAAEHEHAALGLCIPLEEVQDQLYAVIQIITASVPISPEMQERTV
ncbi:MAG: hypothetical protein IPF57_10290 [Gammaproteobacteria bacterium]|jgi:hypothetical protein|nr:hypothetical protein [Gammaproteobacteria bacterium]